MTKIDKSDFNNLAFGDIIKVNFAPSRGHEQKGYRPALVVSDPKSQKALGGIVTLVPITNSTSDFFTRVNLDSYKMETKGDILMDQVKTFDLSERKFLYIERAPKEVLASCNIIFSAIYESLLDSL